ncbi:carbohydrate ABC transporter permease [Paenibacillus donghaensis]|uniref:ABC transporter n=1 Tax=Paenibacillus donghaensis TaxID=414771 RepID=A0A2Z2K6I4_9BACL|nr:carbohydrate ABC transporter permease [Paenibacillus donghaensis]ASA20427.1 ABC transporter [Paenibacillus donghaensis]
MISNKLYKVFIYVILSLLALSIVVPMLWVLLASVKEKSEFYGNPWSIPAGVFIQNYIEAFTEASMGSYLLNSLFATLLALVILLAVAVPAAYVLARYKFKGRKILNLLFMGGLFINVNYIVVPIFLMLLDGDKLLGNWFPNGLFIDNLAVLALVYAATTIPFTIYLLSGYFQTIPEVFEEAAAIDGCSHFTTMVRIMIPMARPSIVTVILFNFLAFWNDYIIALTLLPGPHKTLPVGLLNLMTAQKAAANYGRLYAGLVIVMVPALILYILVQRRLVEGMTAGGTRE